MPFSTSSSSCNDWVFRISFRSVLKHLHHRIDPCSLWHSSLETDPLIVSSCRLVEFSKSCDATRFWRDPATSLGCRAALGISDRRVSLTLRTDTLNKKKWTNKRRWRQEDSTKEAWHFFLSNQASNKHNEACNKLEHHSGTPLKTKSHEANIYLI